MSPAVLLVLVTFASGSGAMATIDMPSREVCVAAATRMMVENQRDTSARCIDRRTERKQ